MSRLRRFFVDETYGEPRLWVYLVVGLVMLLWFIVSILWTNVLYCESLGEVNGGLETRYRVVGGCQVHIDGHWLPADQIHVLPGGGG